MLSSPEFTIAVSVLALALLLGVLVRAQSALMGLTLLVLFSISSASLSGFLWGRIWGLPEDWITEARYYVFGYSALGVLAFVLGVAIAWWPLGGIGRELRMRDAGRSSGRRPLAWVNAPMIRLLIIIGVLASLLFPFVRQVPTLGTTIAVLPGTLKLAVVLAVICWKRDRNWKLFALSMALFAPLAVTFALYSGHTPLSMDVALLVLFVAVSFSRFSYRSLIGALLGFALLSQFMFAWMNARWVIRYPEAFGDLSREERAAVFFEVFQYHLFNYKPSAESVHELILERMDHGEFLAMQADYQPGVQPYQNGATVWEGLYALVPRIIWPDKPLVTGFDTFVSRFTGMERSDDQTAIGVPIQFELYANGGPAWVIVGLFILGLVVATLEKRLFTKQLSLRWLLATMSGLLACGYGIDRVATILGSIATIGGALFIIGTVIEKQYPEWHRKLLGLPEEDAVETVDSMESPDAATALESPSAAPRGAAEERAS